MAENELLLFLSNNPNQLFMKGAWTQFKKYLFEVLAIITGITLSFLFDEWRDIRLDRRTSRDLLSSISDNLKKDTAILAATIDFHQKMMAGESHILNHSDSLRPDSTMLGLLAFQTYPTFRKTNIAYLTMVQAGQARVIENKKLLAEIIDLYQTQYGIIDEWTEIDRRLVLDRNLPFANQHFPYVRNYNYASLMGNNKQFATAIQSDEFRNLLNNDYAFKATLNLFYTNTQKQVDSLLQKVEKEVKRLQ